MTVYAGGWFSRIGNLGQSHFAGIINASLTAAPVTAELPKNFQLSQNYPNPFNPSAKIAFRVASRELVSLKVYKEAVGFYLNFGHLF